MSRDPHWYRDATIYQLHVKSFFDSNRIFPEDSLAAAVKFARENGQHTVYICSKDISV